MSRPTPRPWRVVHHGKELSIEGPEGSDPNEDNGRKAVCFIDVFGVEDWDAENEANMNLIVERVNAGEECKVGSATPNPCLLPAAVAVNSDEPDMCYAHYMVTEIEFHLEVLRGTLEEARADLRRAERKITGAGR